MKFPGNIFSYSFLLVLLFCNGLHAAANDSRQFTTSGQQLKQHKTADHPANKHTHSGSEQEDSNYEHSSGNEIFFIHTAAQRANTTRTEESHFLTALFLSVFAFNKSTANYKIQWRNEKTYYPDTKLLLIFPHHYFW